MNDTLKTLSDITITSADYRFLEIQMAGGFGGDAVNAGRIRYANPGYRINTSTGLSGAGMGFNLGLVNQNRGSYAARLLAWALKDNRTLSSVYENFGEIRSRLRSLPVTKGAHCMKWADMMVGRLDVAAEHALIDLLSKALGKPGWQFIAEQSTDTIVDWLGVKSKLFDDYVGQDQVLKMLGMGESEKDDRIKALLTGDIAFPTYRTLWSGWSFEEQLSHAVQAIQDGCKGVKLKIGFGIEKDLERLRAIRKAIGEGPILSADSNSAYSTEDAIELSSLMGKDDIGLHFFEEPIHPSNLKGYQELYEHVSEDGQGVRIAAGERDGTIWSALSMLPNLHHWQGDLSRFSLLDQVLIACFLLYQAQQDKPSAWWTTHAGGTILNTLCVQAVALIYALGLISKEDVEKRVLLEHISSYDELANPMPRWRSGTYAAPNTPGIVDFSEKASEHITTTEGIWTGQSFDALCYSANSV